MLLAGGDGGGLTLKPGKGRVAPGEAGIGGNVNLTEGGGIEHGGRAGDLGDTSWKRDRSPPALAADVKRVGPGDVEGPVFRAGPLVDPDAARRSGQIGRFPPGHAGVRGSPERGAEGGGERARGGGGARHRGALSA